MEENVWRLKFTNELSLVLTWQSVLCVSVVNRDGGCASVRGGLGIVRMVALVAAEPRRISRGTQGYKMTAAETFGRLTMDIGTRVEGWSSHVARYRDYTI